MADIRRDDQRAGEVIFKLRGLLRQHSLDLRILDLASLIEGVLTLVRTEAAAMGVRLQTALGPAPASVRGDSVHLQQVLLNLVINGLDAAQTDRGQEKRVCISTRLRDDRMLEVSVSDSGPGVPPDEASRIFEAFYTTKPTGMGIGLSICRTILEAHGGQIWLDADVGGGQAFRFTLPTLPESRAS